jgi:hypothetical protein
LTSNFIELYPNVLTAEECAEACNRIDDIISRPDPGNACNLSDNASRTDWNIYTSSYGSLKPTEDKIVEALSRGWRKYNSKYTCTGKSFFEILTPAWKFQRSEDGGGFHQWHHEQGSGRESPERFAVWMIYLNDVEQGGKTEFKYQDLAFTPTTGTLLIWPASYTHVHRANPDLVGKKYIATGWFVYPKRDKFKENT